MITGTYDELMEIARNNVCGDHGTPLEVAWYGEKKTYRLYCGAGHYVDRVERELTWSQEYRRGSEVPLPIKDKIERRSKKVNETQGGKSTAVTTTGVPATDLGTNKLLDKAQVQALIDYAHKYGLDPHRNHVYVMYGQPYVGLDGYLYKAAQSGRPYKLYSRPVTKEERENAMVGPLDHAWICDLQFLDDLSTFTGQGIVTKEEMEARSDRDSTKLRSPVVAAKPWQLAQNRAEWQALRRAFPIGEEGVTE